MVPGREVGGAPWVLAELALAAFLRNGRLMTQRVGVHAQVREVEIVHTAK
jgi:hypothetical protein